MIWEWYRSVFPKLSKLFLKIKSKSPPTSLFLSLSLSVFPCLSTSIIHLFASCGEGSERQPIMSCHYFLPPTQRHKTLRNIFLAELAVWSGESAEFWIPYGKRKQLVRSENMWTPPRIQRGGFLCSLSCRWATGSWGEAAGTAGRVGQHMQ